VALLSTALALAAACGRDEEASDPSTSPHSAGNLKDPRPRGLWVLCEGSQRVLEEPARIRALTEDARRLGATDLFVQVYRGGRAWFDSSLADDAPYRAIRTSAGTDTLADLITRAHDAGLRVHAWVNTLSLASNRNAPIVRELGRDVVVSDRRGRSILDFPKLDVPPPDRTYYRMGTPAVWLDPGAPGVAERLAETFAELVRRYPELDGVHLDHARYPDVLPFSPGSRFGVGLDFGYGAPSRARFREQTGLEAPMGRSLANATAWDEWRRDQVTELVRKVRAAVGAVSPEIQLSAAVWTYADRAYLAMGQDWRRWLEEGLLDLAVPMTYTRDDRILGYHARSFASAVDGARIWVGMGTWLFASQPERALEQIRIARTAGTAGEALFSYDSIADSPALRDALIREAAGGR
jgi:uncharacterized lipoprotein YddW (UPF0748 family)